MVFLNPDKNEEPILNDSCLDHIAMDLWMIGFSLFMESIRSEAKSIIYGLLE